MKYENITLYKEEHSYSQKLSQIYLYKIINFLLKELEVETLWSLMAEHSLQGKESTPYFSSSTWKLVTQITRMQNLRQ